MEFKISKNTSPLPHLGVRVFRIFLKFFSTVPSIVELNTPRPVAPKRMTVVVLDGPDAGVHDASDEEEGPTGPERGSKNEKIIENNPEPEPISRAE